MFLDMSAGEYLVAVWFIGYADKDILATLCKCKDEPGYLMRWRFRYYEDSPMLEPDAPDKSFWKGELPNADEEEALRISRTSFRRMAIETRGELDEVMIGSSNPEVILQALSSRPWCNLKKIEVPSLN